MKQTVDAFWTKQTGGSPYKSNRTRVPVLHRYCCRELSSEEKVIRNGWNLNKSEQKLTEVLVERTGVMIFHSSGASRGRASPTWTPAGACSGNTRLRSAAAAAVCTQTTGIRLQVEEKSWFFKVKNDNRNYTLVLNISVKLTFVNFFN